MANYSEAYDFSLFEERDGNAVKAIEPRRRSDERERAKPTPKENIVELPQEELEKNARPKIGLFTLITRALTMLIIVTSVIGVVYSQVELTELTDQINTNTKVLTEEQALEIQLEMQTAEKINTADVEEYARKQLGMSKITEDQVIYMNMASSDKGTVLIESTENNFIENVIEKVKSWFA